MNAIAGEAAWYMTWVAWNVAEGLCSRWRQGGSPYSWLKSHVLPLSHFLRPHISHFWLLASILDACGFGCKSYVWRSLAKWSPFLLPMWIGVPLQRGLLCIWERAWWMGHQCCIKPSSSLSCLHGSPPHNMQFACARIYWCHQDRSIHKGSPVHTASSSSLTSYLTLQFSWLVTLCFSGKHILV